MLLRRIAVEGLRASAGSRIECEFPGRFSIVAGANGVGKTTLSEALFLGHRHVFPQVRRPLVAALGSSTERAIEIEYAYEDPELHPFWSIQAANGQAAPQFSRGLEPSMGRIRATSIEGADDSALDSLVLLYLRADRRPSDELAGREARLIVEALRAQQQRTQGHRRLTDIKRVVGRLLDDLHTEGLIESLEERVGREVRDLTAGVDRHFAFLGRAVVDDDLLSRILEFVLSTVDNRQLTHRLEISGLGYVNLLHLAVILAAIPGSDSQGEEPVETGDGSHSQEDTEGSSDNSGSDAEVSDAEQTIAAASEESDALLDSLFPSHPHVTVVIEEPEAHLHPQLQHGLTRHLKRVVARRPELQVILTSHSSEVISGASVRDLVVLRREESGVVARSPNDLPGLARVRERVLRMADRHLDVTRSAALFADRLVVVEGITDALLLRAFGRLWCGEDAGRTQFLDALTIVLAGSRIGDWIPRLLATSGHEIADRLAILADSDRLGTPKWMDDFNPDRVRSYLSDPTLEPALVAENPELVAAALDRIGADLDEVSAASVETYFAKGEPGRSKKADFAEAILDLLDQDALAARCPSHMAAALEFLFDAEPVGGLEVRPIEAVEDPLETTAD